MKKIITQLALVLVLYFGGHAQTSFAFSYDGAGNMIQRKIQVLPPAPSARIKAPNNQNKKDTAQAALAFKVYPNPASTQITIEGQLPPNNPNAKWQLLSNLGQVISSGDYSNGEIKTISLADLKSACYFLTITDGNKQKSTTYKIIVSN